MKSSVSPTEQIDKFHEDICRWHLFEDIINKSGSSSGLDTEESCGKQKFYSADEYLQHWKGILIQDLRALIAKHAISALSKNKNFADDPHPQARYQLAHRQRLKKFFALDFHAVKPEPGTESHKREKVAKITPHDLVLAVYAGSKSMETQHMLCVVDSVHGDDDENAGKKNQQQDGQASLVIVKIVLRDAKDLDERNYNLYNLLTKSSDWILVKICNLENFNRSYVGFDQF
jgi:hypothetical protein